MPAQLDGCPGFLRTVSYTHLDVYKRQVFGDTQEAETEKLTRLQANLEKI